MRAHFPPQSLLLGKNPPNCASQGDDIDRLALANRYAYHLQVRLAIAKRHLEHLKLKLKRQLRLRQQFTPQAAELLLQLMCRHQAERQASFQRGGCNGRGI